MQNINVNIVPDSYPQTIRYSQGDVGREFKINVVGFTIPTGATVKIQATKPSGFGFSVAGTVDGNAVSFTTTAIMTDEAGRFPAELEITKDSVVIGTANFIMWGEANPHPEGTTDGQQGTIIPELTLLVERVEAAASSVLDMEVVANTLPAGSQATYSYDEDLNKATFGIPQGEAGAGAAGVVASAYSASATYKVGDYVIHNSNLYRCTTAITTAEAFTAAHWTQIVLADDVSDLKTDLDGITEIVYTTEAGYLDSNSTIHVASASEEVYTNKIPVLGGQKINVSLSYPVSNKEMWLVYGAWTKEGQWLGRTQITKAIQATYKGTITVPATAGYIMLSYRTWGDCVFSANYVSKISDNVVDLVGFKNEINLVETKFHDTFHIGAIRLENGASYDGTSYVTNDHFIYMPPQSKIVLNPIENNLAYRYIINPYDKDFNYLSDKYISSYVGGLIKEYNPPEGAMYINVSIRYDVSREMTSADLAVFEEAVTFNVVTGEQDLSDKINTLDEEKTDTIIEKGKGTIVCFEDGGDNLPVKNMSLDLPYKSPKYSTFNVKGYGKNLCDPSVLDSYKQADGSYRTTVTNLYLAHIPIPSDFIGQTVTISAFIDMSKETGSNYLRVRANINGVDKYPTGSIVNGGKGISQLSVVPETSNDYFYFDYGSGGGNYATVKDLQIELGSFATDYEEYVSPNVIAVDLGYFTGLNYYGGNYDFTNGKLVSMFDSSGNLLEEPTTLDVVKRSFKTHLGGNTIILLPTYGSINVSYVADTKKHLEKMNLANAQAINKNIKAVNHRGYNRIAPENTLPAFKLSKQMGFEYVETDVQFTSDDVAVLIHDFDINRTARNADGSAISSTVNIADITYEQALTYDFGIYKGVNYKGTKIPTLDEFLTLCRNIGLHPYIEIKTGTQAQIESIVDMVEAHGMKGKVTYIADNSTRLLIVKAKDPNARLGSVVTDITSGQIQSAIDLMTDTNEVFMDAYPPTSQIVSDCITAGLPIEVWTLDTKDRITALDPYVSGVTSDYLLAGYEMYKDSIE